MKTVVLRGPVMTQSGYGVHSRQVAKWLINQPDISVKFMATPWGDTPWILDKDFDDGLVGKIMERTVGPDYKADVSFQLQLPNEWDPKLSSKNVGLTASVETDKAHPSWVTACNSMDAVVFPSNHAKESITSIGEVTKPVHVIPESFCEEILGNDHNLDLSKVDTEFNFLVFGQLTGNNPHNDRKNILFTIKWLCEVFKDDPDVGIVLKTNSGRNTKIDRNLIIKILKNVLSEVRKGPYPKLHLLHGELSNKDVAGLYTNPKIKALVTLTRGEGYGLPILEAAASGLPVIATNWSGHLDFLKHTKFTKIDSKIVPVHPSRIDDKIFVAGAKWAEPLESDFKKKIAKFRSSPTLPKEWALEGANLIKEKYRFSEVAKIYDDQLGHFLK
jgi:glycosyltransferase involved in cell wall biosynthesis